MVRYDPSSRVMNAFVTSKTRLCFHSSELTFSEDTVAEVKYSHQISILIYSIDNSSFVFISYYTIEILGSYFNG